MKSILKTLNLLLLTSILMCGCGGRSGERTICILASSDIHGAIYKNEYLFDTIREGSLLQIASLIEDVRSEHRDVIYIDAGDIITGSGEAYHDIVNNVHLPSLPSILLQKMGCDAFVIGNHEFDMGVPTLDRFVNSCTYPILAANICYENSNRPAYTPYTVVERRGVRVAILGLTTTAINYTVPSDLIDGLEVKGVVESAEYWVPYIRERENIDLLVVVAHSGLEGGYSDEKITCNEVLSLAERVEGIDVIFYGHDHKANCQKVASLYGDSDSVMVINPGSRAKGVSQVTVNLKFEKGEVVARSIEGQILPVDSYQEDRDLASFIEDRRTDYIFYLDSILGYAGVDFIVDNIDYEPTVAMDYLHEILARSMTAEVTLMEPIPYRGVISQGRVTPRDLLKFYPYENTIVSLMLYGKEIYNALEYGASQFSNNIEHTLQASGLIYSIDLSKQEGNRVSIKSMANGAPFVMNRLYRVTMDSYLAFHTESPFVQSLSLDREALRRRLIITTRSDFRYHIITDFAVKSEQNMSVVPHRNGNWIIYNR